MTDDDASFCQPERGPAQICNPMQPSKNQNAQEEPGAKPQGQSLAERRAKAVYTAMERSAKSCSIKGSKLYCQFAASLGMVVSRLLPTSARKQGCLRCACHAALYSRTAYMQLQLHAFPGCWRRV